MVCKYCGGEIKRGQNHCPYCGREADPREKYIEYRNVYVNQPQSKSPEQIRAEEELRALSTRAFVFALLSTFLPYIKIIFLVLAFVFYRKTANYIETHKMQIPPAHRAAQIFIIISLVFLAIELIFWALVAISAAGVTR